MQEFSKVIIGRVEEQALLADMLQSNRSDMLAVTGRRRVGKTYLIRNFFAANMAFEMSGMLNATNTQQLQNFQIAFEKWFPAKGKKKAPPNNWLSAFEQLSIQLSKAKTKAKPVLFFDELPWLDTRRSGFLAAFDWFWNSWAVKKNILVVICGSASSWMTSKIINSRGGLHNRVTKRIHLKPFTLTETEAFLQYNSIKLSRYQIIQLYMALGGIPHYLKEIKKGQSAAQNIHRICFDKNGLLVNEFDNLYKALFINAKQHIQIIQVLAAK